MPPRAPRPRPLPNKPEDMTDTELQAKGYIRVHLGPFGILGSKVMTLREFNRQQAAAERKRQRRRQRRKAAVARKAKKTAKKVLVGGKKKHKKQWLGGLLYWD